MSATALGIVIVPARLRIVAVARTPPHFDRVEGLAPGDRAAGEDDRGGARVEGPRADRPVVGRPDRAGQGERARGLGDDDEGQVAPAAVVAAPVKVCAPAPLMSRVAAPPVHVEAWLMAPPAASGAGPVERP